MGSGRYKEEGAPGGAGRAVAGVAEVAGVVESPSRDLHICTAAGAWCPPCSWRICGLRHLGSRAAVCAQPHSAYPGKPGKPGKAGSVQARPRAGQRLCSRGRVLSHSATLGGIQLPKGECNSGKPASSSKSE